MTNTQEANMREESKASLKQLLASMRSIIAMPEGFVYRGIGDFLLQHGVWYEPVPYPINVRPGLPRCCFANAVSYAAINKGWRYVEGYASLPISGRDFEFPVHHGWNLDANGNMVDVTWLNHGTAYLGVEFSIERAYDAMWSGDSAVLDDWRRDFQIFRKPWTGEDNSIPASPELKLLRRKAYLELIMRTGKQIQTEAEWDAARGD